MSSNNHSSDAAEQIDDKSTEEKNDHHTAKIEHLEHDNNDEPEPAKHKVGTPIIFVFGIGILAVGAGFAISHYMPPFAQVEQKPTTNMMAQLVSRDAFSSEVEMLTTRIAALENSFSALLSHQEANEQLYNKAVDQLQGITKELEEKLAPNVVTLNNEMNALKQKFSTLSTLQVDETIDGAKIRSRLAVDQIKSAIALGLPFADSLAQMPEDMRSAIPQVLSDAAAGGVVSLAFLQNTFPQAARDVLKGEAKDDMDTSISWQGRFSAFIKGMSGARSVVARDGNTSDDILSRAEADLQQNNLSQALNELSSLSDVAKEKMAHWLSAALLRQRVVAAFSAFSDAINNK